ncbi:uncharacterized protein LOC128994513 isoform X2 [Macrosteles quadrilineatus]|uniref:uncharacterized protein LOC128994513 isoform X2 n=1 Tax=Macrosteles quadrilineatus TaxID=74068 RepID=UPI0023E0993B|nr:uncharacterized protein LOC128994513 isoform X2 [Macrosteles quadrilineatus]
MLNTMEVLLTILLVYFMTLGFTLGEDKKAQDVEDILAVDSQPAHGVPPGPHFDKHVCCYDQYFTERKMQYNESLFRNSEFYKTAFWPDGIIWYDMDPHMDPRLRTQVSRGIEYFNNNLGNHKCIRWEQRLPDGTHDHIHHWVTFVQTNFDVKYLYANLGYDFEKVNNTHVYLSYKYMINNLSSVGDKWFLSRVLHVMMNVMGFNHEFVRRDRDCSVFVSDYIIHGEPHIYQVRTEDYFYSTGFPYDLESVLHYPIIPKDFYPHDTKIKTLGRNDGGISTTDWEKIRYVYCKKDVPFCSKFNHKCDDIYNSYLTNPNCFKEGPNYGRKRLTCRWIPKKECQLKFDFN